MSNVKVISPYFEQNGGDSVLSAIDLSSPNSVKEITFQNEGDSAESLGFTFDVTSGEGTYLGPEGLSTEVDNTIDVAQRMTTFISSADNTVATLTFVSSEGNLTSKSGQEYVPVEVNNLYHQKHNRRDLAYMHNHNGEEFVIEQNSAPLLEEDTSSMLLRTNPKLTGNIKLTIDSKNNLWLNSMDANKELSDSRFKRVKVNPSSSYSIDVFNFFDKGNTPPEIVYTVYNESSSYFSTQTSLSKQHDRFYAMGGYQLVDKMYAEDFAYFAPIRLQEKLPDYFVIFKSEGAYNDFTYTSTDNWSSCVNDSILKGAKTVKTFDLTENSNIGKYIRKLVNHPARKMEEMTVSLQQNSYTTFNGIAYNKGSFAQMGEILDDYFSTPNTQIGVEEYLTLGFERNKLLSSSILNLEFLFDDENANDYEINRYFGLYLSKNDLAKFHISLLAQKQFSDLDGQYPVLPASYADSFVIKSFEQENSNGIKLYADSSTLEYSDISVYSAKVESLGSYYLIFAGDWTSNPYLTVGNSITVAQDSYEDKVLTVTSIEQHDTYAKIFIDDIINAVYTGGIATFTDDIESASRDVEKFYIPEDGNRLFYVQDKHGAFYTVNSTDTVSTKTGSFSARTDIKLNLNNTNIDIADFTGEKNMLSQTEATISNSKGHSVAELEFSSTLQNGDSITIDWYMPSSYEPMRWKVYASSNYVEYNEVWPEASTLTDEDGGKYYSVIFNPGDITSYDDLSDVLKEEYLNQMAVTIKKAFDTCPFKVFDVVVSGKKLYFRSKEAGEFSNSLFVRTSVSTKSIMAWGIYAPVGRYLSSDEMSFSFVGGSDNLKDRAKILTSIASGIGDDEYFKIKGSFAPLKTFSIWGTEVNYFPNLTEPVYKDDVLVDFTDKDEYSIVQLETNSRFDTTYDSKITSYEMFKPTFGIFSIFPVKDFDNDYFSSDYTATYDSELVRFFDNEGVFTITGIDTSGKITFDKTFSSSGEYNILGIYDDVKTPKNFNGKIKLVFPSAGLNYAYVIYYMPEETTTLDDYGIGVENEISKIVILNEDQELYFDENNLATFKGFFTIDNQVSEDGLTALRRKTSDWDFSRFTSEHSNSEYLRSYENFSTEYALTSKVVPYICKWVAQGKDIRDNKYRFNFNRAFGTMNFSPSDNISEPDPRYHTHEWPYIGNIPHYIDRDNYNDMFSYMFENVDGYDFTSVERDWFIEYFSVGYPTEHMIDADEEYSSTISRKQKFSLFKYDSVEEKTYTMFRGTKISVSDLINGENVNQSNYDGYKFSSVIVSIEEDDRDFTEPVEIELIINEKFKFIVSIIKVRISSYKNPNAEISYLDLYTMQNRRDIATYTTYDLDKLFISPLLTDVAEFNFKMGVPSDIILDNMMSLGDGTIWYQNEDDKRMLPLSTGAYSYLYGIYAAAGYSQELSVITQQISKYTTSKVNFYDGYTYIFDPEINFSYPAIGIMADFWKKITNYYSHGGDNFYLYPQKLISFDEISKSLSMTSTKIQPQIYHVTSDGTVAETTDLRLKFISPEKILQDYDLIAVSDSNKPPQLYAYDIIGVELMTLKNQQYIYRYQGDFTPKFRNIFMFGSREEKQFSFSHNNDFKFRNTYLLVNDESYVNKNCYYNKVADIEILNIPTDSGFKSLYPLVDEISIDRKDEFVWNSTWDNKLYEKYTSTKDYTIIKGTNEMKEYKSFFGSKMMKVPQDFSLYEFEEDEFSFEETVTGGVTKYVVKIDVGERLLREMLGTDTDRKAREAFYTVSQNNSDVISTSDVEAKCKEYIQKNILDLYRVDNINFYLLETGNNKNSRSIVEIDNGYTLSESSLISNSYIVKKDVKSQMNNLTITLEFLPDDRYFTSIGFGIDITRI